MHKSEEILAQTQLTGNRSILMLCAWCSELLNYKFSKEDVSVNLISLQMSCLNQNIVSLPLLSLFSAKAYRLTSLMITHFEVQNQKCGIFKLTYIVGSKYKFRFDDNEVTTALSQLELSECRFWGWINYLSFSTCKGRLILIIKYSADESLRIHSI